MSEAAKHLLLVVSALFPIVDPLGGSPIFLALTREYESRTRRRLARAISVNSFFLLFGSYFIGARVLAFFGISLPVVQVGGGLLVVASGWTMLRRRDDDSRPGDAKANVQSQDPLRHAFYPLTLPLTVGPGTISVAITLGANSAPHGMLVFSVLAAVIGMAFIALTIFLCFGFADRLARVLGVTGMAVIDRLASFLLLCIGVQIMWNGISELLASVPVHVVQ